MNFNIIHIPKTDSSNNEAKRILQKKNLSDFSVIYVNEQTSGKGQRNNKWISEAGKNLTFSIIGFPKIKPENQFYLSKVISSGINNYLNSKIQGFKIKWPNDIYYQNKKICGILIENSLSGQKIKNSVTGIGININQTNFPDKIPNALSLKNITGIDYNIENELHLLLNFIFEKYKLLSPDNFNQIDKEYMQNLYKINITAKFKDKYGIFEGKIIGTTPEGKLIIKTTGGDIRYYNFKEVEFL